MNTELMFSSKSDEWETPIKFFNERIYWTFGFNEGDCIDVAASINNNKLPRYFTKEDNGLKQEWKSDQCWMNPPYGREIGLWIKKAYEECLIKRNTKRVVCLLPARTDTKWFHEIIYNKASITFIKGRLKFGESKNSAPFPSMIVVFS